MPGSSNKLCTTSGGDPGGAAFPLKVRYSSPDATHAVTAERVRFVTNWYTGWQHVIPITHESDYAPGAASAFFECDDHEHS